MLVPSSSFLWCLGGAGLPLLIGGNGIFLAVLVGMATPFLDVKPCNGCICASTCIWPTCSKLCWSVDRSLLHVAVATMRIGPVWVACPAVSSLGGCTHSIGLLESMASQNSLPQYGCHWSTTDNGLFTKLSWWRTHYATVQSWVDLSPANKALGSPCSLMETPVIDYPCWPFIVSASPYDCMLVCHEAADIHVYCGNLAANMATSEL